MAIKPTGSNTRFILQRTHIIAGTSITSGNLPQATDHHAIGMPKTTETVIIPNAAGLKICWRMPLLINCFETNAAETATAIIQTGALGSIISPIKAPVTNDAEGQYSFLERIHVIPRSSTVISPTAKSG